MTDINQWRRGLPARARTPALDFVEHEHDTRSASVPPTPRRGVRPKLSSYFTQAGPGKTDPLIYEDVGSPLPSWDPGNPFPSPNADSLMESIMCRLMSNPYDPLEPRFNGMLLQIFEEFRNLKDEKESLKAQVELERDGRYADKEEVLSREAKFEEERMEWKAEVKRLELLLAKGKRGLAEVTKARQDSVIRRRRAQFADSSDEAGSRRKETIVEFLQKSKRYEDKAWSSQRATMRVRRPQSPSLPMRALSRKLQQKTSMTSIHADLPFGTPPSRDMPSTSLAQVSFIEQQAEKAANQRKMARSRATSEAKTSCSVDTFSTFSNAGDHHPELLSDGSAIAGTPKRFKARAKTENDLLAARQIADVISTRRGVSTQSVLPQAFQLLNDHTAALDNVSNSAQGLGIQVPSPKMATTGKALRTNSVRKSSGVMAKASGFFHRLRPQLNLDTTGGGGRRFSFELGDDNGPITAPFLGYESGSSKEHLLRKSVSVPSLMEATRRDPVPATALSPIESSPVNSAPPTDSRRSSKIPSPAYHGGSMARPRQDRENSQSSLLTAIKHSEDMSRSRSSLGSSVYSSPSIGKRHGSSESYPFGMQQASSSNSLLEHTNTLRGGIAATAAAKAISNASARLSNHDKQGTSQSSVHRPARIAVTADITGSMKENARPVRSTDEVREDGSHATI